MQNQYSLTYREEEREMNAYCKFAGIGIIPWSPLNGGQLARPVNAEATPRSDHAKGSVFERKPKEWEDEIVRLVEQIAKTKGWTMAQVSLAWINEKVTSPIVGISSVSVLLSSGLGTLLISALTGQTPGRSYHTRLQAHGRRNQISRRALSAAGHSWAPVN
jgi:aryl-alcohol dehydrogenase-like predicted oxidoreductase